MTEPRCPRDWELEQAHDGRLSHAALHALEQHVKHCATCSRARDYLESLADALRNAEVPGEELVARRLRPAVLRRAQTASSARSWTWQRVAVLTAGAMGVALLGAVVRGATLRRSNVSVSALSRDAQWTRRIEGDRELFDVRRGKVQFHVEHHRGDLKLWVHVPDGEIEDLGTAFTLNVRADRTQQIAVSEGVILFYRTGAPALPVVAGERWQAPDDAATSAVASQAIAHDATFTDANANDATRASPECAIDAKRSAVPEQMSRRAALVRARSGAQTHRVRVEPVAAAVAVDSSGAAEDAAYLRILALLREQRREEARLAARAYLSDFPNGFRKPDVEKLVGPR